MTDIDERAEVAKETAGKLIDMAVEHEKKLGGDLLLEAFQINADFRGVEMLMSIRWFHNDKKYGVIFRVGEMGIFNGLEKEEK